MKFETKFSIAFTSIVLIVILVSLISIYNRRNNENSISIDDNFIKVEGMFGTTIKKESVVSITLQDTLPKLKWKDNGFSLAGIKIGRFRTVDKKTVRLYIYSKQSPFIEIKLRSGDNCYIHRKDSLETIQLYNRIIEQIKKDK